MKKFLILLLATLCLSGCQMSKLNTQNIEEVVTTLLADNASLSNQVFEGYKYYLPKGVSLIQKADYNAILLDKGRYYYLYVDAVSYFHKIEDAYQVNASAYFSKTFEYNGKKGYIEITQRGDHYFIEAMYHYAKIESLVTEKELSESLISIFTILNSVEFQDQVLATMVGDNVLNYKEVSFNIFQPKREESEFLEIVKEFGTYQDKDNELPDEDQIPILDQIK